MDADVKSKTILETGMLVKTFLFICGFWPWKLSACFPLYWADFTCIYKRRWQLVIIFRVLQLVAFSPLGRLETFWSKHDIVIGHLWTILQVSKWSISVTPTPLWNHPSSYHGGSLKMVPETSLTFSMLMGDASWRSKILRFYILWKSIYIPRCSFSLAMTEMVPTLCHFILQIRCLFSSIVTRKWAMCKHLNLKPVAAW
jgi:hypothetical protein